jgi:hypothetical protein
MSKKQISDGKLLEQLSDSSKLTELSPHRDFPPVPELSKHNGVEPTSAVSATRNVADINGFEQVKGTSVESRKGQGNPNYFKRTIPGPKQRFRPQKKKKIEKCTNWLPPGDDISSSETRFVFHACNVQTKSNDPKPKGDNADTSARQEAPAEPSNHPQQFQQKSNHWKKSFGFMSAEDALEEQERLFREAAARMRTQAKFRVSYESEQRSRKSAATAAANSRLFTAAVTDVHLLFPNHWEYADLYARLGLPRTATDSMIVSHYRKLAKVYHPDRNVRSKADSTKHKFQAVTEAYSSSLMNR